MHQKGLELGKPKAVDDDRGELTLSAKATERDVPFREHTVVIPPLHRLTQNVYKTKHHVCGSLTAIHTCLHTKVSLSITPVLFLSVRCTAMARSVLLRNRAVFGLSGSKNTSQNARLAVMAPRKRNINCQLVMVWILMLPIP